ncbi:response regulator [Mesotoga prima]|uniref:Response regulator with CheY-like receiver, AAA-type ATPase, and DNA-binding domains n=1 Tax=Mesotoga prima MesG1.Ag.4.2 TaxID=660470 RepID=I2F5D4_9BACT|nr:response regulator [Mesotoga prima]CCU83808.1 Response regulator receiver protein [Mesotoga infera]AFK07137.1 response regulator with CheY-like receiver, AAA-type ATPase, and DNA-binding domains [Mesotoga prima MesG1.Ag.4.2]HOZ99074.1 response regulator [Mesotoga prima]HQN61212.1 response regulator [Mesotoga prima]HUM22076.1 response regulator [Mesotoga prima]
MALVYVVDDELNVRRIVKKTMENENNEVHTFVTAEEALEEIEKRKPDLLFTDISLPSMNGIQFLKELKNRGYSIPVIVISSDTSPESMRSAFKAGIVDFLTKPFTPQEIRDAAELALREEDSIYKRAREIKRLIEEGETAKAESLMGNLFSDFPGSPFPHFLYALLVAKDNPRVAIKHLKASLSLDEDFKDASDELKKLEE